MSTSIQCIEWELLSNCRSIKKIQFLKLLFGWLFCHISVYASRLGCSPKAKYTCETNTSWVSPCGWTGARIFLSLLINSKMVELFKVVWWIHWDTITPTERARYIALGTSREPQFQSLSVSHNQSFLLWYECSFGLGHPWVFVWRPPTLSYR